MEATKSKLYCCNDCDYPFGDRSQLAKHAKSCTKRSLNATNTPETDAATAPSPVTVVVQAVCQFPDTVEEDLVAAAMTEGVDEEAAATAREEIDSKRTRWMRRLRSAHQVVVDSDKKASRGRMNDR